MPAILLIIALLVGAVLLFLASRKGAYRVCRSRILAGDPERVFEQVRDLRSWPVWSPWLMHEPDANLEFSAAPDEEGGSYSWDGQRVGAGRLTHVRFERPHQIVQQIEFQRPFRSVCDVTWEFEPAADGTRVSWCMAGRMPFFMRFMTARIEQMVGRDYELGLAMLAGVIDPQAEHPQIRFEGVEVMAPKHCLCLPWSGDMSEVAQAMSSGFPRLAAAAGEAAVGAPFTLFHKLDPGRRQVACEMAVSVAGGAQRAADADMEHRELDGGRYFKVTLLGSYEFLELTWFAAMAHLKMRSLRLDGSSPALEVYQSAPGATADRNALRTALYLPLK